MQQSWQTYQNGQCSKHLLILLFVSQEPIAVPVCETYNNISYYVSAFTS